MSSSIVLDTLHEIVIKEKGTANYEHLKTNKDLNTNKLQPMFFVQYG